MTRKLPRVLTLIVVMLVAGVAQANAGAPLMLYFVAYPLAWLALAVIITVEMFMARRIIDLPARRALALSVTANLASALIGLILSVFVMMPDASTVNAAFFTAIFLIPAFFCSVFVERWVAYLFVAAEKREAVRRWSWSANIRTYEGLMVLLLAAVLFKRFF